jgi:hypothetical protein
MRDLATEARSWRETTRHPFLGAVLADMDDETLVVAYRAWWATYTASIQKAPSNRMGISSNDAAEASGTAYRAVLAILDAGPARMGA